MEDILEEGVDEAVDENGTIGDNQNDIVYIFIVVFSLSFEIISNA